ncbi:MAG: response regulator [Bdellovibrionota bacterium]
MPEILIVEDDAAVASTLAILLQTEGYETRTAANGIEGLRALRERLPDLTITDIEMPVLDGPGMANRMLIEDNGLERIPIVVISGFPEIDRLAEEVGTPYYILKPYSIDQILELIQKALQERIYPIPFEQRKRA